MEFTREVVVNLAYGMPIFIFSLSIHEAAHAITAKWGGDLTAAYQGRVTLNPLSHIDPIGTLVMPIIGAFSSFGVLGWARPVPVVSTNFRRGSSYDVVVSLAGPFSNLLIAFFATVIYQGFLMGYVASGAAYNIDIIDELFQRLIRINILLMVFNLLPLPPLDGSHVAWHWFIKHRPWLRDIYASITPYGFLILLVMINTRALSIWLAPVWPLFKLCVDWAFAPLSHLY
ncbi:site-2 protease family protein [soil metagenome]